jgi:predicted nucleic acid-binding protein
LRSILVDTSVWRKYFSGRASAYSSALLDELLDEDGAVLVHPAVLGELVLAGLSTREEALFLKLPRAPEVSSLELLAFVHDRGLARRGIGWVDCHLLASALLAPASLWSLDRGLSAAASTFKIAFSAERATL